MLINILTVLNGVGLEQDARLIKSCLVGHTVRIIDIKKQTLILPADINIFLEIIDPRYFSSAKRNILFPNPEWFDTRWIKLLDRFDTICCKTIDCCTIFSQYSKRLVYTGFTSGDYYQPEQFQEGFIHVAGKSSNKNTEAVCRAYEQHPDLNVLYLLQHQNRTLKRPLANVEYVTDYVAPDYFRKALNTIRFHICTSQYEGFGHYINEARSVGAVIITTDAPPMNEMVDDQCGVLVPVSHTGKQHLGTLNYVSPDDLYLALKRCEQMPEQEINERSRVARARYLEMDKFFRETFKQII